MPKIIVYSVICISLVFCIGCSKIQNMYEELISSKKEMVVGDQSDLNEAIEKYNIVKEESGILSNQAVEARIEVVRQQYLYAISIEKEAEAQIKDMLKSLALMQVPDLSLTEKISKLCQDVYLLYQRDLQKAKIFNMKIVEFIELTDGKDNRYLATPLNHLGEIYMYNGEFDEADKLFLRAYTIVKEHNEENSGKGVRIMGNITTLQMQRQEYDKAQKNLEMLRTIIAQRAYQGDSAVYVNTLNMLGEIYLYRSLFPEAIKVLQEVVDFLEKNPRYADVSWSKAKTLLGFVYLGEEKYDLAAKEFEKVLDVLEEKEMTLSEYSIKSRYGLARVYETRNQISKARRLLEESLESFDKIETRDYIFYIKLLRAYASILEKSKVPEKAAEYYTKTVSNMKNVKDYATNPVLSAELIKIPVQYRDIKEEEEILMSAARNEIPDETPTLSEEAQSKVDTTTEQVEEREALISKEEPNKIEADDILEELLSIAEENK